MPANQRQPANHFYGSSHPPPKHGKGLREKPLKKRPKNDQVAEKYHTQQLLTHHTRKTDSTNKVEQSCIVTCKTAKPVIDGRIQNKMLHTNNRSNILALPNKLQHISHQCQIFGNYFHNKMHLTLQFNQEMVVIFLQLHVNVET